MNQRQFLASLDKEQRLYLSKKSDRAGLVHLLQQWSLIILLMVLVSLSSAIWLKLIFMIPLGILLVFQFTLLHETSHRTPFANRSLNDAVGRVCGFILLIPPEWFRLFHLEHHKYTNNPESDPELAGEKPQTRKQYLRHISGLPTWWSSAKSIWDNAFGEVDQVYAVQPYIPEGKIPEVRREARIYVWLYVFVILTIIWGGTTFLTLWIIPVLLGQPFLRLYLLAEHSGCPHSTNIFENTRTTYSNRLMRWLAWNMPYHVEHHVYAAVPFYKLAELHELTKGHLVSTSEGYLQFNQEYFKGILQRLDK